MSVRKDLEALRAKDAWENPETVARAFQAARHWTLVSVQNHLGSQILRDIAQQFDARFGFAEPRPATGKATGYVAEKIREATFARTLAEVLENPVF